MPEPHDATPTGMEWLDQGSGIVEVPIYEYHCQACGSAFEKIVFASSPRVSCPSCGSDDVQRRPSSFGIGGSAGSTSSGSSCSGCHRSSCAGCR